MKQVKAKAKAKGKKVEKSKGKRKGKRKGKGERAETAFLAGPGEGTEVIRDPNEVFLPPTGLIAFLYEVVVTTAGNVLCNESDLMAAFRTYGIMDHYERFHEYFDNHQNISDEDLDVVESAIRKELQALPRHKVIPNPARTAFDRNKLGQRHPKPKGCIPLIYELYHTCGGRSIPNGKLSKDSYLAAYHIMAKDMDVAGRFTYAPDTITDADRDALAKAIRDEVKGHPSNNW